MQQEPECKNKFYMLLLSHKVINNCADTQFDLGLPTIFYEANLYIIYFV